MSVDYRLSAKTLEVDGQRGGNRVTRRKLGALIAKYAWFGGS